MEIVLQKTFNANKYRVLPLRFNIDMDSLISVETHVGGKNVRRGGGDETGETECDTSTKN